MKKYLFTAIITMMVFLSGCDSKKEPEEKKIAYIAYAEWVGTIALTNLTKVVLEDMMGYKVYLKAMPVNKIYPAVAGGQYDFFMGAWLPITHERYMHHYKRNLRVAGANYRGAKTGLAVPDYVPVNSIGELNENADRFNSVITGIEKTSGAFHSAKEAKSAYELNFKIKPGSSSSMLDQLKTAVQNEEWIVVTGWQPHWMVPKFKLKFLQDPKRVFSSNESVSTITRKDLPGTNPELYKFLQNVQLSYDEMESLLNYIHDHPGNPETGARKWLEMNKEIVKSWIPEE